MAAVDEGGVGGATPVRVKSDARKAARKLRKAEDVAREAPLTVQTQEAREAKRQGGGRNRERRRGGEGGDGGGSAESTPDELELRRLYAGRIREARAAAGGGAPDPSGGITVSAEEMQLRREYASKLRELRGGATVTVAAPPLVAAGVSAAPSTAVIDVGAASARTAPAPGRPLGPKAAKAAARAAQEDESPLPDSWRPPVPSGMGGGRALLGGATAPLAAPVLRPKADAVVDRLGRWLAARPGARGALAGLAMFLFWELCRAWGGQPATLGTLGIDIVIWGVAGLLAWRLFLGRESDDA